jgi:hypothetical protein
VCLGCQQLGSSADRAMPLVRGVFGYTCTLCYADSFCWQGEETSQPCALPTMAAGTVQCTGSKQGMSHRMQHSSPMFVCVRKDNKPATHPGVVRADAGRCMHVRLACVRPAAMPHAHGCVTTGCIGAPDVAVCMMTGIVCVACVSSASLVGEGLARLVKDFLWGALTAFLWRGL